jgi:hypothetical protein
MAVTIRAFALTVLAMALIVSVGYSAESTFDRSDDVSSLVAPMAKSTDSDLLIDMVGFAGSKNVSFSYRGDWEQWQREGNVTIPAVGSDVRMSTDRMRFLEENTILPAAIPDPPAISAEELQFFEENEILPGPVDSRWLLPNGNLAGDRY